MVLAVGDEAPDFELAQALDAGDDIKLSDYRGKSNVLLCFYPFDFSGACGEQLPVYQANSEKFENANSMIDDEYFRNYIEKSYLGRGLYAQQLKIWFELFDRNQILILSSEELSTSTNNTMNRIFQFLGLPDYKIPDTVKRNTANYTSMKMDTRKKLITFFSKYNQDLFKLLNEEFVWNK